MTPLRRRRGGSPGRRGLRGRVWALGFLLLVAACACGVEYLKRGMLAGRGYAGADDLPLVAVGAVPVAGPRAELMAVMLTGDGGWGWFDRAITAELARGGIPTVGWNSLRYYWHPRSPEEAAEDLQRVIESFSARWERPRVLLVGYSFGADALPFLVSRLPPATRARVAGVALVAMGRDASFHFRPVDWISRRPPTRFRTVPEVGRLAGLPVACVYGTRDGVTRVGCPLLRGSGARVFELPGGHHFNGRYRRVARLLLEATVP